VNAVMAGFAEVRHVRQVPGEPRRRWFNSRDLELIVWLDESGSPIGFQLCYDRRRAEHALTWTPELGFLHMAVDDGEKEAGLRYKATPILVPDGHFNANRVSGLFAEASGTLPPEVAELVAAKLRQHPNYVHRA